MPPTPRPARPDQGLRPHNLWVPPTGQALEELLERAERDRPVIAPIGGPGPERTIAGMDAFVQSPEAARRIQEQMLNEVRVGFERIHSMGTEAATEFTASMREGARTFVQTLREEVVRTEREEGLTPPPERRSTTAPIPPPERGGRGESPASEGDVPTTDRMRGGTPEAEVQPFQFEQFYDPATGARRGYSVSALRQDVGEAISRRVSRAEWGPEIAENTMGRWYEREGGRLISDDDPRIAQAMRARRAQAGIGRAAQSLAQGENLGAAARAAIPTAARVLGIVGAGAAVLDQTGDFFEGQREQNRTYQAVLGGGQAEAYQERARNRLFQLSQTGFMGDDEAARLYQGVTSLGFTGGRREEALDFATRTYRELGMSIDESMDLIRTATEGGVESLSGLAESLREVTATAREAGVSAQAARQVFTQGLGTLTEQVGPAAGLQLAGPLTQAQTRMGLRFMDENFAQAFADPNVQRMMGSRLGLERNQVLGMLNDPTGQGQVALTQDWQQSLVNAFAQNVDPAAQARIRELAGGRAVDRVEAQRLGTEIMRTGELGVDVEAMRQVIQTLTGLQVDEADIPTLAVQALSGGFDPAADVRQAVEEAQVERIPEEERARLREQGGVRGVWDTWEEFGAGVMPGGERARAQRRYREGQGEFGMRSKLLDRLTGESFVEGRKFRVRTAEGDQVVGLDTAMRYYLDQLARGDVEVVSGAGAGQTVSEAMNLAGDMSIEAESAGQEARGRTESFEAWQARQDEKAGAGGGRIVVAPTPDLARWLHFQTSGSVTYDPTLPPPAHVAPTQRPTG